MSAPKPTVGAQSAERECPTCDGNGDVPVPGDPRTVVCTDCKGDGTIDAAPAPLDPGNPAHRAMILRLASKVVTTRGHDPSNLNTVMDVADYLTDTADRLDGERAEAEHDAADRKRAEEAWTAANNWPKWGDLDASVQVTFTSGYRAGRAADHVAVDEQSEGDKKILIREADVLLAAMIPYSFGERVVRRLRDAHARAVDDSIRRALQGER